MLYLFRKWWKKKPSEVEENSDSEDEDNGDVEAQAADEKEMRGRKKGASNVDATRRKLGSLSSDTSKILDTRTAFFEVFQHMLYASQEKDFTAAHAVLQKKFSRQTKILSYVDELITFKEEWACHMTSTYLNFGHRTTSPNEATNGAVKRFGLSGKTSFDFLYEVIERWVDNRHETINDNLSVTNKKMPVALQGSTWLGNIKFSVSLACIRHLAKQRNRLSFPLPPCTKNFTLQFGLPCAHKMERRDAQGKAALVDFSLIHPFWHNNIEPVSFSPGHIYL